MEVCLCDGDGVAVIILVFSIENCLVIAAGLAMYNRCISEFGQFVVKSKLVWSFSLARTLNSPIPCIFGNLFLQDL